MVVYSVHINSFTMSTSICNNTQPHSTLFGCKCANKGDDFSVFVCTIRQSQRVFNTNGSSVLQCRGNSVCSTKRAHLTPIRLITTIFHFISIRPQLELLTRPSVINTPDISMQMHLHYNTEIYVDMTFSLGKAFKDCIV